MPVTPAVSGTELWIEFMKIGLTILGFVFVGAQLWFVKRTLEGNSASKLYDQYLKINELFLSRPELRPYFYNNETVPQDSEKNKDGNLERQVHAMSEAILGMLEHAALQRANLPSKSWKQCWKAFTRDRFETSTSLRQFFVDNRKMYAKELRLLVAGFEGLTFPEPSCQKRQASPTPSTPPT